MANRGTYIDNLPRDIRGAVRRAIRAQFIRKGYRTEEADDLTATAMKYRLGDIEDIIDSRYWIDRTNRAR